MTEELPVHRRELTFDAFEREGALEVVGRLRDLRPWAKGTNRIEHVHEMQLRVLVSTRDLVITEAEATMERFPHAECPTIEDAFGGLVGLCVARGYSRAVQERFGRALGCTHLELLARSIGPVVIQAVASSALRLPDPEETREKMNEAGTNWFLDTCHVWASEGPGMQKVALGWRPGTGGYPAPSVEEVRELYSKP